jgi:hypothetical protein
VAGAAYLMMAVVLITVHRVVPHSKRLPDAPPDTRTAAAAAAFPRRS